jgi:hypothetical protein
MIGLGGQPACATQRLAEGGVRLGVVRVERHRLARVGLDVRLGRGEVPGHHRKAGVGLGARHVNPGVVGRGDA